MIFTPHFIALLSVGIALFALSGTYPGFLWLGVVLDAALIALAAADYILTPGPEKVEIERQVDEKLSLGAPNVVLLKIRNRSTLPAVVRVRDEPPHPFDAQGNTGSLNLRALGSAELQYRVIPPLRGDFSFGDIYVRRMGLLRMLVRQHRISARQDVKVYPDLTLVRRREAMARRGRVPEGRPRRFFGPGTEFESLRDYRPDDEFRNIDWKATARRGRLTSRNYQVERSQYVVILLDAGRTMGVTSNGGLTRLDYAVNAAAALAFTASGAGDQVGLLVFAGDVEVFIPPGKGRSQALTILQSLYGVGSSTIESEYSTAFLHLSRRWRKRSLVVLLTDLIDPDSSQAAITNLAILAKVHLPMCLTVGDLEIFTAAQAVPAEAKDAYRKAVARQVVFERRRAIAELERAGVVVVDTDGPSAAARLVESYLEIKARGRL